MRVGFLGYGACQVIDLAIGAFAGESGELRVETRTADFTDPSAGLGDSHVDAAFVRPPISSSDLELEALMSEPRVAVLPAAHPLAARDRLAIAELLSEPWLQMPPADRAWHDFWLATEHRGGAKPLLGPEVRTVDDQLAATAAGGYVSLTAESVAAFYPRPGIAYVPVDDIGPSEVAIAWRRGDERAQVRTFVAAVRDIATATKASPSAAEAVGG